MVEVRIPRHDIDGVELIEGRADLLDNRIHKLIGNDVLRGNVRGPGIGDVVAPLDDDGRGEATLHSLRELPLRMLPELRHFTGDVECHAVVCRCIRIAGIGNIRAVPLGKRIDLQHIEAFCCSEIEVLDPLIVCRARECCPDRICQPEERLPVTYEMQAFNRYLAHRSCPVSSSSAPGFPRLSTPASIHHRSGHHRLLQRIMPDKTLPNSVGAMFAAIADISG